MLDKYLLAINAIIFFSLLGIFYVRYFSKIPPEAGPRAEERPSFSPTDKTHPINSSSGPNSDPNSAPDPLSNIDPDDFTLLE